jgi:hypothetical protein
VPPGKPSTRVVAYAASRAGAAMASATGGPGPAVLAKVPAAPAIARPRPAATAAIGLATATTIATGPPGVAARTRVSVAPVLPAPAVLVGSRPAPPGAPGDHVRGKGTVSPAPFPQRDVQRVAAVLAQTSAPGPQPVRFARDARSSISAGRPVPVAIMPPVIVAISVVEVAAGVTTKPPAHHPVAINSTSVERPAPAAITRRDIAVTSVVEVAAGVTIRPLANSPTR